MRVRFASLLLLIFLIASISVHASTEPNITIEPGPSTIGIGQTMQYSAEVTGLSTRSVAWAVNDVLGGNTTLGTISKTGLYQAPSKLATFSQKMIVSAVGSDAKTKGTVLVNVAPIGPAIRAVSPNPIAPGKYTVALHGIGFLPGAVARNGVIKLLTTYVSETQLTVTGDQATLATAAFQVSNPGTAWGPATLVPFRTHGAAPQISPASIYLHLGQSLQFTATATTFISSSGGTVAQSGYFVAPNQMPTSGIVTVIATGPGGFSSAKVILAGGPFAKISPATVSVPVGQKQQFTSMGAKQWTAEYGMISATGLYTAPTIWPKSGSDQIWVDGTQGTAIEKVKITPAVPAIKSVSSNGQLPLGQFSMTVYGDNFSPASWVEINGLSVPTVYFKGELRVSGFFSKPGPGTVIVSNYNLSSKPYPIQIGLIKPKVSPAAARRFLEQAAFGPTPNDAENLQAMGFQNWLNWQFSMPQVSNYKGVTAQYGGMPEQFLTNAVGQPDQLRQRVAFALSQIFVTSLDELSNPNMISYQDMLLGDAFKDYRQIMADVTLSPAMGQYLNIANNAKADPAAGSLANENFAREMMQLFTLGTSMLNPDGTVQLDATNIPVPTYSQFTVTEFARVYTGWTYAPAGGKSAAWNTGVNNYGQLVPIADQHDPGSKQLLNGYVSPANASPLADLNNALNNIFSHSNIGPFVSTQLIQHLVKSNPSPAYVARVAKAFNNNGSGVKGDMKAVISAILLDPEARANDEGGDDLPADGHLQEPALYIAGMVRAFAGQMNDKNYYHWEMQSMGEDVFSSPSVFNYFAPNFGVPDTSLLGGEFQIYSPNNAVVRANEVSTLFSQWSNPLQTFGPGTSVNLAPFLYLASNPAQLVAALDLTLTHGKMPAAMKEAIETAVEGETGGALKRVEKGSYLILTSSYYNVWH